MKLISLDDLSLYSAWPAYLLNLTTKPPIEPLKSDYEARYALADEHEAIPERIVAVSKEESLYAISISDAQAFSIATIRRLARRKIIEHHAASIVDLGCGNGALLSQLGHDIGSQRSVQLRGLDLSPSGVVLAQQTLGDRGTMWEYDLTSKQPCIALAEAQSPAVIITSFALHQLPSSSSAIELLAQYRDLIAAVVTFEPEEELFGDGLLGLLRRRYGQVRGYSADTLKILQARDDVEIIETRPNAFGANALLPGTLVVWRFQ